MKPVESTIKKNDTNVDNIFKEAINLDGTNSHNNNNNNK